MARRIKETPVLTGKDVVEFLNKTNEAKVTRVDAKERNRIRENFAKLNAIASF
jgi:hypothetical protein